MSNSVPMEFPVDYVENGDGTMKPVYKDEGSRLRVYFRQVKRPDTQKMLETGKEEWFEEILLYKKVKGSTNIPASRATAADKRIYRREWEAFQRGQGSEGSNLLSDLYGIKPHDLHTLRSLEIGTIEELASTPDEVLQGVDGGLDLKDLANIWIRTRTGEAENTKAIVVAASYKKENTELLAEIERLKAKLEPKKTKAKAKAKAK